MTVTEEVVRAAVKAHHGAILEGKSQVDALVDLLFAVDPLMEAQAKAEALAQLIAIAEHEMETGTWQSDKWTAAQVRDWLRARLATTEGKDS